MNKKIQILKFIEQKRQKGSLRKPKYGTRKLTIGLVSCMLGFIVLVSPAQSQAAEANTKIEASEDELAKKPEKENKEELDNQDKKADEEAKKEAKKLEAAKADAKSKISIAYKKAEKPEKTLEDYMKAIDDANSEDAIQAIVSEVEALEPKSEKKNVDEKQDSTETPIDKNAKEEDESKSSEVKTEGTELEIDKKEPTDPVANPEGSQPTDDPNAEKPGDVDAEFNKTQIKATIKKNGLNGQAFNFEKVFDSETVEVELVNKETGKVVGTKTINSSTDEIVFDGTYDMDDVKNNKYQIRLKGKDTGLYHGNSESIVQGTGENGWSAGNFEIFQSRNKNVVVETTDDDTKNPTNNPSTEKTEGKLKLQPKEGELRGNKPIDIPETSDPTEIGPRERRSNKDVYDKGFDIEVEGTQEGYLVDKKNNEVYKPKVTVDENGIDPSKVEFTKKPLVSSDDKHANDEDRVKVEFDAGKYGKIEAGKTYYIIKNVEGDASHVVPPTVTPNKGWTHEGWDGPIQNKYTENTKHTATYKAIPAEGKDITTNINEMPSAESGIKNKDDLPEGTEYEWKQKPDVSKKGQSSGIITVKYPDGTSMDVTVNVTVNDNIPPTITAEDFTAVEGKEITPVPVTTDDENAKVKVENLPEGLTYNPETKQIEGTVPKAEDWGDKEEKTVKATVKAVDESGNESTKDITVTVQRDTDGDGIPDVDDDDDDNDGIKDEDDKNPKVADKLTLEATPKTQTVIEGQDIKDITAKVNKDGAVITNDQGLTVEGNTLKGKAPTVEWKDDKHETEDVTVTITATKGEGEKAETITETVTITVQRDTDGDGIPDVDDDDDDNDGIKDEDDKNPKVADKLTLEATPKTQTVIEGQDIKDITAKVNKDGAVITNDQGLTVEGNTLKGKAPTVEWKDDKHETEDVTVTITATKGEGEKAETITETVTITVQRDTDGDGIPDVDDDDDDNDGIKDEDDKNPKVADKLTLEATPKTQTVIEGQDIKDITAKVNKDGAVITNDQGLTVEGNTLKGKAPTVEWKDDKHETEDVTVTITATKGEGEKAETITETVTITVQRDTDGDGIPDVDDDDDDNDGIKDEDDKNPKVADKLTLEATPKTQTVIEGQDIKDITAKVNKDGAVITNDQGLTVEGNTLKGKAPTVEWKDDKHETEDVTVTITATKGEGEKAETITETVTITVQRDTDGDGIPDVDDDDDDNDGIKDEDDKNPKVADKLTLEATPKTQTVIEGQDIKDITAKVNKDGAVITNDQGLTVEGNTLKGKAPTVEWKDDKHETEDVTVTITATKGEGEKAETITETVTITVQRDTDGDGIPDVDDDDDDNDGIKDEDDKNPKVADKLTLEATPKTQTVIEGQDIKDITAKVNKDGAVITNDQGLTVEGNTLKGKAPTVEWKDDKHETEDVTVTITATKGEGEKAETITETVTITVQRDTDGDGIPDVDDDDDDNDGIKDEDDKNPKVADKLTLEATPKTQTVIEGQDIKDITAKVNKDGAVITNDQGLTVEGNTLKGKAPTVEWKDDKHETEDVTVTITATKGEGEKAETITETVTITVQRDTDGDGIPDVDDDDDDNDGIKDEDDKNPKVADKLTLEATPKTQTVIEGQDIKDITAKVNKDGAVITNDQGLTVEGNTLKGKAPTVEWKDDKHETEDVTVTITATKGEGEKAETITETVTITVQRDTDGDGIPDVDDDDDDNDGIKDEDDKNPKVADKLTLEATPKTQTVIEGQDIKDITAKVNKDGAVITNDQGLTVEGNTLKGKAPTVEWKDDKHETEDVTVTITATKGEGEKAETITETVTITVQRDTDGDGIPDVDDDDDDNDGIKDEDDKNPKVADSKTPEVDQPTEGDDKITGKGEPGSKIVVTDDKGNKIGETEVNEKGEWEVEVPSDKPLKENDKITVEQTEKDKKPSTTDTTVKGKDQSEAPKVNQPTEGDDKITGTGKPGAKIVVKDKDGNIIGETTVGEDGKWEVKVPKDKPLNEGDKITVEQTEKGKKPNTAETTVKGKDQSEAPKVNQPTEGDDKITGTGKPGSKIVVTDDKGNKIGETEVNEKGEWEVKVPKDKPLNEGDKITVEQTEKGKKPNTAETTVKGKDQSEAPKVNQPTEGDDKITGTGKPGSKIVVTDDKGNKIGETEVNEKGEWEVEVPSDKPLNEGDKITVEQTEKGKKPSTTDTTVKGKDQSEAPKVNQPTEGDDKITGTGKPGSKIVVTDDKGNKIGETEVNEKGEWEVEVPSDKPLKENDKITVEQTEKGKKPNTAETTVKGKDDNGSETTPGGTTDPTNPTTPGDDNKPEDDQKPGDDNKPGDDQKPGDDNKPSDKTIADKVDPTIPEKTGVKDPKNLTDKEKEEVKKKIEDANKDKFPEGTKVEIGKDGTATITYPDGSKDTIKGSDLVEKISDAPTRPSRQDKPSKKLPKAGIESEAMMMAAAALSTLGGLYVSKKKKEDEE
ncbi:Ig-like domain-containing protein [Finegoldia magna]|uniref:Ig-like domain-containing protein n=1 Tax=Finegoldia magna TaxID=1260 RepID=UPI001D13A94A|nr:Ig-like domain-containing protein [Finegoldia magna]UEA69901.1 Ig-like domain-containing protein [Finegoldia magna]